MGYSFLGEKFRPKMEKVKHCLLWWHSYYHYHYHCITPLLTSYLMPAYLTT